MSKRVCIPEVEYQQRIQKAAALVQQRGLDVLVVNSNEADYANVRYFSNFWPLFETAGVAISPAGKAALMVGPESLKYAGDRSMIQSIFQMMEYRESADPAYPELKASTFTDVFNSIGVRGKRLKIGVGGYLVSNPVQLAGMKECYPDAEIIRADDIMVALRGVKSENEIACMREGFRITEIATQEVIRCIQPGMTELQLVGIAQKTIYENGAEYEGLPMYVFSERSTRHAISRSTYREIQKGDIVQLNLSAKVNGYSPSIGMPISMGRLAGRKKEIVEFGLDAHRWTYDQLKAGVLAADVAKNYIEFFKKRGRYDNYLYGPCHGTGLIEVEAPWMETISNYHLAENMTFQVDTFVTAEEFGIRWETGVVIRKDRAELLSKPIGKIFEVGTVTYGAVLEQFSCIEGINTMKKAKARAKACNGADHAFDVVLGLDMETDIGSFTPFYEGVKHGTQHVLDLFDKHNLRATFFWTGHAAENNPEMVRRMRDAGHETGCHGLFHETLGDPIFPLPNNWPILPSEVEGRLNIATKIVRKVSGIQPTSFRCPRLWGSTKVLNVLEKLGYLADASFPLYYFRKPFVPYHPSSKDWTQPGRMRIVEIPNFCDLTMESKDPYQRDRDQWPVFRTESAEFLMQKADGFIDYVKAQGKRPVLCFYLHPWEFHPMPQGALDFGESSVRPLPFIVKNCGPKAVRQLDRVCDMLKARGGRFITAKDLAEEYS